MAGGGPLLTDVVEHRPDRHTADNAAALVAAAFPRSSPLDDAGAGFRLTCPRTARRAARALVGPHPRYIVVHASGGRAIKQWDLDRFGAATTAIARAVGAAVVLSGAPGDAPLTAQVRAALPADIPVVDLTGGPDLLVLAAVLEGARLVLTGDTGPMHLAAAVRAPVVAVFGPSMPVRYAPRSTAHRVVRVDLWCAPCNMIRKPPARCQGHTPDCLTGVTVDAVTAAALSLVAETEAARRVIGRLAIERGGRVETIDLDEYGAGAIADEAAGRANAWIKSLRHVDVAGRSLRDRFHYRGDSLWWFAELFLHKEGVVDAVWRTALTLDAVCEVEEPTRVGVVDGGPALRHLLPQVAARLGHRPAAGHRRRPRGGAPRATPRPA